MNDTPYYTIIARRWWDGCNTYHSCEVYQDGRLVERVPYAYGYGEIYRQTAHEILQRANLLPTTNEILPGGAQKDYYEFLMLIRDYNHWLFSVTDVKRKKDL